MQKFTAKIVNMMKAEKLFQTQGGPIIMAQVLKKETQFFYLDIQSKPLFSFFNEFYHDRLRMSLVQSNGKSVLLVNLTPNGLHKWQSDSGPVSRGLCVSKMMHLTLW